MKTVAERLKAKSNKNKSARPAQVDGYEDEPPVPTSTDAWPVLDAKALIGLPGDIVRTIEPTTEADPVALLGQTLIAFGSLIGRTAHFTVESDRHYLNEFIVLVGRTSKARKGTSWGRVWAVAKDADQSWSDDRVLGGLSSGEGVIHNVRDERRGADGEIEEEGITDKRLLVYEPEFANVLKHTERQGNTLSVIVRNAWDGTRRLQSLTRHSPLKATDAHVSIVGHVTIEELTRLLTTTESANGFANRFLWLLIRRSKVLPEGGDLDARLLRTLQDQFKEAVAFARDVETMRRDEDARRLWNKGYEQLSDGKPGLAGALLGRAEAHVMRLACLYALMDRSWQVTVVHLDAALAFWKYVEATVTRIWGQSLGEPMADEILRALQMNRNGMNRTNIRDLFNRHAKTQEIERALGILMEYKLARMVMQQTEGRAVETWLAT